MEGARAINGVTFGSFYCEDFDLILASRSLGNPRPKISKVEVPGSSVTLDFTEAFGSVNYSNRTISLVFLCLDKWDDQYEMETTVRNAIHGQKMRIKFDEDDGVYFVGRISVDSWTYFQGAGRVQISIDCDPWKYKERSITLVGEGSEYVALPVVNNGLRAAVPTFTILNPLDVMIDGESVRLTVSMGTYSNPNLFFLPGDNTLQFRGAAERDLATVTWTEAML